MQCLFVPTKRRRALALSLLLACLASVPSGSVFAEDTQVRYARPSLNIALRQEPRNAAEIKSFVLMDTPVTLLREEGSWLRIRLANGMEGWARAKDLGERPYLPVDSAWGRERGEAVPLQNRFKQLAEVNSRLKQELSQCSDGLNMLKQQQQALLADPEGIAQLKKTLAQAEEQATVLRKQLDAVQIENTVLKKNESVKWFAIGGGVLLVGWLCGLVSRSGRKKKSSLL